MKYIKLFENFESSDNLKPITIERFLENINLLENDRPRIINWWHEHRERIDIYYFPFNLNVMAYGAVFSEDSIAINSNMNTNPQFMLYVALHESMHSNQVLIKTINPYFDKVVEGDYEGFIKAYTQLEIEANMFAEESMRELGYERFIEQNTRMLQQNLQYGRVVYDVMTRDIQNYKPINLIDLLRKMIM